MSKVMSEGLASSLSQLLLVLAAAPSIQQAIRMPWPPAAAAASPSSSVTEFSL
jgi:hypothetical protein